ncbi:MAG: HAD-IA family hydrolase [Clostridiales bacterium]|nr:HAD-IA family hydrolase [Clostridiales bacterium]
MNKGITHVCWDFDGTLYNTYDQITCAMECALEEWGLAASVEELRALLKQSVYHACCVMAKRFSLPLEALLETFQRYHRAVKSFQPYEGAETCLYALQNQGYRHYLYTHRDSRAIRQLEADGLAIYFTGFITREDGFPDKPAPDALLSICNKHSFAPKEAVMIGDRDIDIQAGINAGMHTLLFDPEGFYPHISADHHISRLEEIPPLLRKG